MICPYRKLNDKDTQRENRPFPEGPKIRTIEIEYFPKCQGDECPFYRKADDKIICGRAQKEMTMLIKADKEEERLSIWAN